MSTTITPTEFAGLGDDAILIDVREPAELAEVRIPGALSMPMRSFSDYEDEIPDGTFYVICHSGMRSARVAEALRAQGHDAINVEGGIVQWEAEGRPVQR
jgi:rhodanese-related sulfurtransferase